MKKIKSFIITIIFLFGIFYSINFSFAVWLGPAQCSDNTTGCGYIANVPLYDSCSMSGGDTYVGNRILGGQECYTIGGQDSGGYYMYGTGEPDSNTPIYPFSNLNMTTPWVWTYSKSSDMSHYFGGSSIPTGVFQGSGPYYNLKFFDPVRVSVSLSSADDSSMLQIGSNYVYWTGCDETNSIDVRNVNDSHCPSQNFVGPTNFNAHPGDSISFKVRNALRPNNGSGTWGGGSVQATFDNLTTCYTQAYFDYLCGSPGCSGKPNYIPTAPGVCSPETKPKAQINAYWSENNSQSIGKTITQGQSIQIPFIIENIGDIGSVINNIQCVLSDTSLGSISNCPSLLNK
jgi:hypothetical protein